MAAAEMISKMNTKSSLSQAAPERSSKQQGRPETTAVDDGSSSSTSSSSTTNTSWNPTPSHNPLLQHLSALAPPKSKKTTRKTIRKAKSGSELQTMKKSLAAGPNKKMPKNTKRDTAEEPLQLSSEERITKPPTSAKSGSDLSTMKRETASTTKVSKRMLKNPMQNIQEGESSIPQKSSNRAVMPSLSSCGPSKRVLSALEASRGKTAYDHLEDSDIESSSSSGSDEEYPPPREKTLQQTRSFSSPDMSGLTAPQRSVCLEYAPRLKRTGAAASRKPRNELGTTWHPKSPTKTSQRNRRSSPPRSTGIPKRNTSLTCDLFTGAKKATRRKPQASSEDLNTTWHPPSSTLKSESTKLQAFLNPRPKSAPKRNKSLPVDSAISEQGYSSKSKSNSIPIRNKSLPSDSKQTRPEKSLKGTPKSTKSKAKKKTALSKTISDNTTTEDSKKIKKTRRSQSPPQSPEPEFPKSPEFQKKRSSPPTSSNAPPQTFIGPPDAMAAISTDKITTTTTTTATTVRPEARRRGSILFQERLKGDEKKETKKPKIKRAKSMDIAKPSRKTRDTKSSAATTKPQLQRAKSSDGMNKVAKKPIARKGTKKGGAIEEEATAAIPMEKEKENPRSAERPEQEEANTNEEIGQVVKKANRAAEPPATAGKQRAISKNAENLDVAEESSNVVKKVDKVESRKKTEEGSAAAKGKEGKKVSKKKRGKSVDSLHNEKLKTDKKKVPKKQTSKQLKAKNSLGKYNTVARSPIGPPTPKKQDCLLPEPQHAKETGKEDDLEFLREMMLKLARSNDFIQAGKLQQQIAELEELRQSIKDAADQGDYVHAGTLQEQFEARLGAIHYLPVESKPVASQDEGPDRSTIARAEPRIEEVEPEYQQSHDISPEDGKAGEFVWGDDEESLDASEPDGGEYSWGDDGDNLDAQEPEDEGYAWEDDDDSLDNGKETPSKRNTEPSATPNEASLAAHLGKKATNDSDFQADMNGSFYKSLEAMGIQPFIGVPDDDDMTAMTGMTGMYSTSAQSYVNDLMNQQAMRAHDRQEEAMEEAVGLYQTAIQNGFEENEQLFLSIVMEVKKEIDKKYEEHYKMQDQRLAEAVQEIMQSRNKKG